jgi:hypothetical protein
MKSAILCFCVALGFVIVGTHANAQTRYTWSFSCMPNALMQGISIAQRTSVSATVGLVRCSSLTGEIAGSAITSWMHSYYIEVQGNQFRTWGVMVQTLADGDEVNFTSQVNGNMVNGVQKSGQMMYQITGGTGKMAGIKGSGTCTITYNAPAPNVASCAGQYTLP